MNKINPFTDVWFKDCYHMALIPAVVNSLGNADCLLFNQYFTYKKMGDIITAETCEFESVYDILTNKNIDVMPFVTVYDIIQFVRYAIRTNHCIIVGVDSYYVPMRRDTYNKKHQGHSLLVCGIEDTKEKVTIIEQRFFASSDYRPYTIDYSCLEICYKEYIKNRNNKDFFYKYLTRASCIEGVQPSACLISARRLSTAECDMQDREKFLKRIKIKTADIYSSLKVVEAFEREYERIYKNCSYETLSNTSLISGISEIILAKNMEAYIWKQLIAMNIDLYETYTSISDLWGQVRALLSKHMYTGNINLQHMEIGAELLKRIRIQELYAIETIDNAVRDYEKNNIGEGLI